MQSYYAIRQTARGTGCTASNQHTQAAYRNSYKYLFRDADVDGAIDSFLDILRSVHMAEFEVLNHDQAAAESLKNNPQTSDAAITVCIVRVANCQDKIDEDGYIHAAVYKVSIFIYSFLFVPSMNSFALVGSAGIKAAVSNDAQASSMSVKRHRVSVLRGDYQPSMQR
jgi:hypothetical protein